METPGVGSPRRIDPPQGQNIQSRITQYRDTGVTFGDLLKDKVTPQELKFSAHAENRIKSRNIPMNEEVQEKLNRAAQKVAEKGGKDALLLMKDSAFIVNVKNRTVVTAMDSAMMNEDVFTNIDSAAFAE
ncbi:TIGR02530 family flagellar biosynthesis protein [Chitinivibrio alkaliphilus]|uniref:Flagellar operon protein n=1 Tax=Chitinivibrio alkaliphilus ACht1 TaxID=1313304 RepID=U7D920_9BACT|nr:TIGR02530 family flagellar biosynthesis protein [Chitinivibrio alkaliphilus]ERP32081.1 flagellar operon protein [Chitinivibrio alkaliphilus ACht1]